MEDINNIQSILPSNKYHNINHIILGLFHVQSSEYLTEVCIISIAIYIILIDCDIIIVVLLCDVKY
jgi:hypothetical protein